MTLTFDRPVGAPADVAELEYIAALCQTEVDNLREDGSITGVFFACCSVSQEIALQQDRK